MPSIKQQQVAKMIQENVDEAFRKQDLLLVKPAGMVSVHEVEVSPDLMDVKVFLSFFQVEDKKAYWENLKKQEGKVKEHIGNKLRNKLRRIPQIQYYEDQSIEKAFKIDEILKDLDVDRVQSDEEE